MTNHQETDLDEIAHNINHNIARCSIWPAQTFNTTRETGRRDAADWIMSLCIPPATRQPWGPPTAPRVTPGATQTPQAAPADRKGNP